jgi:hypothetical protein
MQRSSNSVYQRAKANQAAKKERPVGAVFSAACQHAYGLRVFYGSLDAQSKVQTQLLFAEMSNKTPDPRFRFYCRACRESRLRHGVDCNRERPRLSSAPRRIALGTRAERGSGRKRKRTQEPPVAAEARKAKEKRSALVLGVVAIQYNEAPKSTLMTAGRRFGPR